MRKYLILIVIFYSAICCFAQESNRIDMVKILSIEQDLLSLERLIEKIFETGLSRERKYIMNTLRKEPIITVNMQTLKPFHIFFLEYKYKNKEELLNYSFLYKLTPRYVYLNNSDTLYNKDSENRYLRTNTFIYDKAGNGYGRCDIENTSLGYTPYNENMGLMKLIRDNEIDFVFYLCSSKYSIIGWIVAKKGDKLYVIKEVKDSFEIYPWDEFIEKNFDKWENIFEELY